MIGPQFLRGFLSSLANVIADTAPTITVATGDEDLFIQGDLEVTGGAYKPGGGSWIAISDGRLKRDIVPFTDGLQSILRIEPKRFRYVDRLDLPDNDKEHVGVIAQEIRDIAPHMVAETLLFRQEVETADGPAEVIQEGEAFLTYDSSSLVYILVNAVQEQQELIESLRLRIEALEE